jgi:hypothetical protein
MNKKHLHAIGGIAALAAGLLLVAPLTSANAADNGPAAKPQPAVAAPHSQTFGTPVSVPPGGHGIASVICPAGTVVTGGGGTTSAFDITFTDSFASGNGWIIRGNNASTTTTESLTAVVVCI